VDAGGSADTTGRPFISVVIPTYNRAEKLERQLGRLHADLVALDVPFDVRIYDNCSTDDTPQVCVRWQEKIPGLQVTRNPENIGLQRNFILAMTEASGQWTWVISDDDVIEPGAVQRTVDVLKANPDLTLLYLNHRGVDPHGAITKESFLDPAVSGRLEDGKAAFVHHLERDMGGVMLMTATVFRTQLLHDALRAWKGNTRNWAIYAFLTGYAAIRGPIYVTPEIEIDCVEGISYWSDEGGAWTRAIYQEIPSTFLQLAQQGYPDPLCRRLGLAMLDSVHWLSLRSHLRAARLCPAFMVTLPRVALLKRS
jgi:glycosyltransferase involved in cell wall biosynthesis